MRAVVHTFMLFTSLMFFSADAFGITALYKLVLSAAVPVAETGIATQLATETGRQALKPVILEALSKAIASGVTATGSTASVVAVIYTKEKFKADLEAALGPGEAGVDLATQATNKFFAELAASGKQLVGLELPVAMTNGYKLHDEATSLITDTQKVIATYSSLGGDVRAVESLARMKVVLVDAEVAKEIIKNALSPFVAKKYLELFPSSEYASGLKLLDTPEMQKLALILVDTFPQSSPTAIAWRGTLTTALTKLAAGKLSNDVLLKLWACLFGP